MASKALTVGAGKKVALAGAKKATAALDYADGLTSLITAWKDYKITHETQVTHRAQIAADRDVRLAAIQAQADTVRALIEGTFAERAGNFDKFFSLLDQGFSNGNDQQINAALAMIAEQVKVNPMAQAAQLMRSIDDPNSDCIEI